MLRHISQPFNAGGFQLDRWVQPLGDGAGNEGGALFRQQGKQALLFGDKRVNASGFAVEKGSDGLLFREWW